MSKRKKPHFNKKVAKNRGNSWKQSLVIGKMDAALNPSKLRLLRIKKRVSQDIIAQKLKISPSTYGGIERGKRTAKPQIAKGISDLLGSSQNNLFRDNGRGKFLAIS